MRHVMRCRVGLYDPDRRRYVSWVPMCSCRWIGEEVSDRRLVRVLWESHVAAAREVAHGHLR